MEDLYEKTIYDEQFINTSEEETWKDHLKSERFKYYGHKFSIRGLTFP